MPTTTSGQWLNQFVAPQLLKELKDYKDVVIAILRGAPTAAITADGIRWNKLLNNVEFRVNNTADFTAAKMTGEKLFVEWEKYDTTPTEVDDAEIRYLAYDKRAEVRVRHMERMKEGLVKHALHRLCPDDAASDRMPVMKTTGDVTSGRKRATFRDLAEFLAKVKAIGDLDPAQLYMALCPEHVTDFILDRDAAAYFASKEVFFDPKSGNLRSFMGFKFIEPMVANAFDSSMNKKAKGAAMSTGDRYASTLIYAPNTVYHIEGVKVLYSPEIQDTKSANPKSVFRLQAYGLIDRIEDYGMGALVSDNEDEN
ncbi:MAG: hypothetical protein LBL24_07495 [Bacteroidales bacterium]|jgi:hypothetical protein|nr:hypothetical protein [Bacteroidales bacterium]